MIISTDNKKVSSDKTFTVCTVPNSTVILKPSEVRKFPGTIAACKTMN